MEGGVGGVYSGCRRRGVKTHKHVDYICKIKADIINLDDCPARLEWLTDWGTDWVTDGLGESPQSGIEYGPGEEGEFGVWKGRKRQVHREVQSAALTSRWHKERRLIKQNAFGRRRGHDTYISRDYPLPYTPSPCAAPSALLSSLCCCQMQSDYTSFGVCAAFFCCSCCCCC